MNKLKKQLKRLFKDCELYSDTFLKEEEEKLDYVEMDRVNAEIEEFLKV